MIQNQNCCNVCGYNSCTCPCPQGATGPMGPTGPTGPTGATGALPTLATGYFGFSASTPTVITGGSIISFNQTSAISELGVSMPPISAITIQNTGIYKIAYGIIYSSAVNSELRLKVNGIDLEIGHLNIVVETNGEVSTEIITPLNMGDVVSLGVAGSSVTLTTIGTSAFASIVQLA